MRGNAAPPGEGYVARHFWAQHFYPAMHPSIVDDRLSPPGHPGFL